MQRTIPYSSMRLLTNAVSLLSTTSYPRMYLVAYSIARHCVRHTFGSMTWTVCLRISNNPTIFLKIPSCRENRLLTMPVESTDCQPNNLFLPSLVCCAADKFTANLGEVSRHLSKLPAAQRHRCTQSRVEFVDTWIAQFYPPYPSHQVPLVNF